MNELKIWENQEFGVLRVIEQDGEPWMVGKDVAQALGYGEGKSLANAVANHVDPEDKGVTELMTPGGKQKMVVINESGLYSLVLSSKLPGAKRFRRWVTGEVLPSMRMKKYEFTGEEKVIDTHTLHRIRAVRDFGVVKAGDLGGWLEKEKNLSHDGDAWVGNNAWVTGAARVIGDAWVGGNALVGGDADFSVISGFGIFSRTTTFFRCQDGKIRTQSGCFYGDLDEFRAKVKETHGESKMAKEYLMIADLMEMHFAKER